MKVFEKFDNNTFNHTEDMCEILGYLHKRGRVNVSPEEIETLYGDFSEEESCAGWMNVSDDYLEMFADWLSKRDTITRTEWI